MAGKSTAESVPCSLAGHPGIPYVSISSSLPPKQVDTALVNTKRAANGVYLIGSSVINSFWNVGQIFGEMDKGHWMN